MAINQNIKPIVVLSGAGVTGRHIKAAISGIEEMVSYSGIEEIGYQMPIINLQERDDIVAYRAINNHIDHALSVSQRPKKLAAETLMSVLYTDSLRISPSHYLIVIISEDMYSNKSADDFILAFNQPNFAVIASRYRFSDLDDILVFEMLKFTVLHELGHVFGLPAKRGYDYKNSEEHCKSEWCIMRQGMNLDQWRQHAFDSMAALSLCPECRETLRNFFRQ